MKPNVFSKQLTFRRPFGVQANHYWHTCLLSFCSLFIARDKIPSDSGSKLGLPDSTGPGSRPTFADQRKKHPIPNWPFRNRSKNGIEIKHFRPADLFLSYHLFFSPGRPWSLESWRCPTLWPLSTSSSSPGWKKLFVIFFWKTFTIVQNWL